MATALFRHAWEHKRNQAKDIIKAGEKQIATIDKQIETFLNRIMDVENPAVMKTFEDKIGKLQKEKRIITESMQKQAEPKGSFEEKLEPVLQFLASPYKLWEKGNTTLRQTILKLAFTDPIPYCRFNGPRTTQIALPFKALGGVYANGFCSGAPRRNRTGTPEGTGF